MRCHHFIRLTASLSLLASLAACDMRGNFVGEYRGDGIETLTWEDGSVGFYRYEAAEEFAAPEGIGQLELVREDCSLLANVLSWTRFQTDPGFCSFETELSNGAICTFDWNWDEGEGDLRGDTITVRYEGRIRYSDCSDGVEYQSADFVYAEALYREVPDPNDGYGKVRAPGWTAPAAPPVR